MAEGSGRNETVGRMAEGSGRNETVGRMAEGSGRNETVGRMAEGSGRNTLVGRTAERASMGRLLREAEQGRCRQVLLVAGEPGIGKTRLLAELADQATSSGGEALFGRAFEAEMVRPYGAWIDVLRSMPADAVDDASRVDLAPLLPELRTAPGDTDRNRLFETVLRLLASRARRAHVVVLLDDLQWFDEASVALLHYLARGLADTRVLVACAARSAEMDANPRVQALVRALQREGRLVRLDVGPLDAEATRELVRAVDDRIDPTQVFSDGGGNPLFSIELARALGEGDSGKAAHTLDGLIAERLSRFEGRAADLLPWAAALGHAFPVDDLAAVASLPVGELLGALEELERHGVLRIAPCGQGAVGYDFAHDLVRRAAYRGLSEPRRRWMHLQIARALRGVSDPDGALSGDIAHHAAIGGDSQLAAEAYVAAGERSLRLFAYADASRLATSGLQHAERLPPEQALRMRLALLGVQARSNQWLRRAQELEAELSRVALAAQQRGMHPEVSRAFWFMSLLHAMRGDFARASSDILRAAQAGRAADLETTVESLANTGRCLVFIERDVASGEGFLREATALAPRLTGRAELEATLGNGLLHAFKDEDDEAVPLLERAAELAALESDHYVRAIAHIRVAKIAFERGRWRDVVAQCQALDPLVANLSEGSERPQVAALIALARLELGENGARAAVDQAVATLRAVDSKAHLAYALNRSADYDARAGKADAAGALAREALAAAEAVGQKSEAAMARMLLARLALQRGARGEALAFLDACAADMSTPLGLSARALGAVRAVRERADAR
jgi:hypothetical protein